MKSSFSEKRAYQCTAVFISTLKLACIYLWSGMCMHVCTCVYLLLVTDLWVPESDILLAPSNSFLASLGLTLWSGELTWFSPFCIVTRPEMKLQSFLPTILMKDLGKLHDPLLRCKLHWWLMFQCSITYTISKIQHSDMGWWKQNVCLPVCFISVLRSSNK